MWCQLKLSYILFMIDSISFASRNEFVIMFLILSAMCLIVVSLTWLFTYAIFISSIEKWFLFIFSLFCIQNNQLFTFYLESLNKDESDSLIDFKNWFFEIKVLSRLDVASKWCIITFFFFISFCKCVWTTFNVVCCYEHVWINQSSDLILINLIKASHDAMPSLNLAHLFESFSALLLVVQHFLHSSLSSFF